MPSCAFKNCNNYYVSKEQGISYHKFPTDEVQLQKWIAVVRQERSEPGWMALGGSKICSCHFKVTDTYISEAGRTYLKRNAVPVIEMMPVPNIVSRTKESKEGKYVGSSKTHAASTKPLAPTSSAQPPATGQSYPQHHDMTLAQARPASTTSFAASRGSIASPQRVVPPPDTARFMALPARKNSTPSKQPVLRSEVPRSKPTTALAANRGTVPPSMLQNALWVPRDLSTASRQAMTDGPATLHDPGLRNAYAQTTTPPAPALQAPPRAAAYNTSAPPSASTSRVGSSTSHASTASVAASNSSPKRVVPSSDAARFSAPPARKNSTPSVQPAYRRIAPRFDPTTALAANRGSVPPSLLQSALWVPRDLSAAPSQAMTAGPATSRDPRLRNAYAKTTTPPGPALQAPPRAAAYNSSAPPSASTSRVGTSTSHASTASVAASNSSPKRVVPSSDAARYTAPPARKTSTPSEQPAHCRDALRSKPTTALATNRGSVPASMLQSTPCKAYAQTTTPPVPALQVPPRAAACNSLAPRSASTSRVDSRVSLASSGSDERVNTVTDTPMCATPTLKDMETLTRQQSRRRSSDEATGEAKRCSGSYSPQLDNLNTMMPVPNIRTATTGPALNESRKIGSKEGKYVDSSKTSAELSKLRAPTSSAQPPRTGQRHPQHQMRPAQARPASSVNVVASSGSLQSVAPPSDAARFAAPLTQGNPTPSVQLVQRSEAVRTTLVAESSTCRTYEVFAPGQPMTSGVGASCYPWPRNTYAQTATPPIPSSRAPPRAATHDSLASPSTSTLRVDLSVTLAVTDIPMSPTPLLEDMETMTRPQRKRRSSNEATIESKRYCGSRSPPQDNRSRDVSHDTPAQSSNPRVSTSSAQPPTTNQPHPQPQVTPAQARPASPASVAASSDSRSPLLSILNTMDDAGASCIAPGPQEPEHPINIWVVAAAKAFQRKADADASRAASGINQCYSESVPSKPQKMADADASRAASGINQRYSESEPSKPQKNEKKPLKKKNEIDKKLKALKKKRDGQKARFKKTDTEIKELQMLKKREQAQERLEKRKSLNEKDEKMIRRIDENLKLRPTNETV